MAYPPGIYTLANTYPADAIGGGDFLTLAAQRDIEDVSPSGETVLRKERIVVTDRDYDGTEFVMGRVCLSEQTIRSCAELFGMQSARVVDELRRQRNQAMDELDNCRTQAVALLRRVEALEGTAKFARIYVAPDGTECASRALDLYMHTP